jgi:hypothetical protein
VKAMANMNQPIMYQGSEEFGKFMKQATADYLEIIKRLNITIN